MFVLYFSANNRRLLFSVRQAAARAAKRTRRSSSDSSNFDSDMDQVRSSESEYKMSGSESYESEHHYDSNQSSDFNPFESDSDSDADPWVGRNKKKGRKPKKPVKKRPTTQDKIQELLTRKTDAVKNSTMKFSNGGGIAAFGQPTPQAPPKDAIERACTMKEELLAQVITYFP